MGNGILYFQVMWSFREKRADATHCARVEKNTLHSCPGALIPLWNI